MKTIYFALIVGMLSLNSCNSYLDIKPKGFTIPEKTGDYQLLMNSTSLISSTPGYPTYLTDDINAGTINDPVTAARFDSFSFLKKQLYSFAPGATLEDGQMDSFWESAYGRIFTYNVVVNNVLSSTEGSEREKMRLCAEAKVGRAFEYLNLVNVYSAYYNPNTASSDLGVPMVLAEDVNASYERVSVDAVYKQIKKDISEALPHLSQTTSNRYQAILSVSHAFLARVNLYQGNYKDALSEAKNALALNSNLMDYSLYTTKDKTTWGRVCLKTDPLVPMLDFQNNPEVIWAKKGTSSDGEFNAEFYASPDFVSTYSTDLPVGAIDKRFDLFFCKDRASFGPNELKFPGKVLFAPYVAFNMGFGTAEMFLIAAECEARLGNASEAINYLNTLRASRIENYQPLGSKDAVEALKITLDERRREFPFMASTRFFDLKRLAVTGDLIKTIQHPLDGKMMEIKSNDRRMILPVPPKVLSMNPGIPQYER
ncbi:RagB/SusD family nutrient uptake outer membrane protein [Sphingobacterium tabacisoli]|uniref:RagB/SusD family nutrient uptake outer membrane protein n=1 Tax=Sphingobacterium tabacisoli TaxID=2044855 RepID=A0ABW5L342_9SPHI|nr:RagB/SusD family nutrient uptake outer membrane protein [Sphingobacterium tabacisoli]